MVANAKPVTDIERDALHIPLLDRLDRDEAIRRLVGAAVARTELPMPPKLKSSFNEMVSR